MLGFQWSESFGEAAFNQRLNTVHLDPGWRLLIKFLPLKTVAKREKPFSCNLPSAQEGQPVKREKLPLHSGRCSAGLRKLL